MNAVWDRSSSRSGPDPVTRICTPAGETLAAKLSRALFSFSRVSLLSTVRVSAALALGLPAFLSGVGAFWAAVGAVDCGADCARTSCDTPESTNSMQTITTGTGDVSAYPRPAFLRGCMDDTGKPPRTTRV